MVEQNLLFEVLSSSWFFSSLEIHPSCSLGTVFLMKTYPPLITWEIKRERYEHKPGVFAGAADGRLHAGWAGLWVTAPPALGSSPFPGECCPTRKPRQAALPPSTLHACAAASQTHRSLPQPRHRRPASTLASLSSISGKLTLWLLHCPPLNFVLLMTD